MKIYEVDLDGTLCTNTYGDYENASPIIENIEKVNDLYDDCNLININTGRGSTTGIDWYDFTKKQLDLWGVRYTTLTVGKKPYYDYIIDDKSICIDDDWRR